MSSWSYEQLNNWYYVLLLWGEIILCKDILSVALFADWPQIFSSYVLVFVASVGSLSLPPSLSSLTSLDQKSLQQMIQCLQGDPRAFPYQMGYLNPAACFWSSPLLSSSQWLKITTTGRRPGGVVSRCLNHLTWLLSTKQNTGCVSG